MSTLVYVGILGILVLDLYFFGPESARSSMNVFKDHLLEKKSMEKI